MKSNITSDNCQSVHNKIETIDFKGRHLTCNNCRLTKRNAGNYDFYINVQTIFHISVRAT